MPNPKANVEDIFYSTVEPADGMSLKDCEEKSCFINLDFFVEGCEQRGNIMGVKLLNIGVLFVTANQGMQTCEHALMPGSMRGQRRWIPANFPVSPYSPPSLLLL